MRKLIQKPFFTFFIGLWIGMIGMGIYMSSPSGEPCCFETKRLVTPHAQAFSVNGTEWDTTYTYCEP